MMYSLIATAKMNDLDPQAWLAHVLTRIAAHPAHRLDALLPWNWRDQNKQANQAAWVTATPSSPDAYGYASGEGPRLGRLLAQG